MDDGRLDAGILQQRPWDLYAGRRDLGGHDLGFRIRYRNFQSSHSNRNMVRLEFYVGEIPNNWIADANKTCSYSNDGCLIRIARDEPFCGTTSPGCYHLQSVMAHEFGHWAGLQHAQSDPLPASDARVPIMRTPFYFSEARRGMRADDISGFQLARYQQPFGFFANSSFDFGPLIHGDAGFNPPAFGWGFRPSPTVGSMTRYCAAGAHTGPCYVEFNGNGSPSASVYQDLWNWSWLYDNISIEVYVRNPAGVASSATIALWRLSDGAPVRQHLCELPANSAWTLCNFPPPTIAPPARVRFEIYNNGVTNLRVDSARMTGP